MWVMVFTLWVVLALWVSAVDNGWVVLTLWVGGVDIVGDGVHIVGGLGTVGECC